LYKVSGMSGYLSKPFTSQELWTCLIKYIPVIGYSVINKSSQSAEDEKMKMQLMQNFVKDNQSTYENIIEAINSNDIKTAHRLVHTLKSAAAQIGEKSLQIIAAAAESLLSKEKNQLDEKHTFALKAEIKSVLDKLAPLAVENDAKSIEETTDAKKVKEIIEKLEPMLKNKNPECEDLLDEIRTIPGAQELALHIEKFDFKKANEEFTKIKGVWETK